MTSQFEVRERNKLFRKFCEIACPDYANGLKKNQISQLASNLFDYRGVEVNDLYCSIRNFLNSSKEIIISRDETPCIFDYRPKKESLKYKQDACKFIKEKFNINLLVSNNIAGKFYDSIIQNLINTSQVKIISLEDKLLDDLDFLKENAKRGMPPCVFGDIQRVDSSYEGLKKYIRED